MGVMIITCLVGLFWSLSVLLPVMVLALLSTTEMLAAIIISNSDITFSMGEQPEDKLYEKSL